MKDTHQSWNYSWQSDENLRSFNYFLGIFIQRWKEKLSLGHNCTKFYHDKGRRKEGSWGQTLIILIWDWEFQEYPHNETKSMLLQNMWPHPEMIKLDQLTPLFVKNSKICSYFEGKLHLSFCEKQCHLKLCAAITATELCCNINCVKEFIRLKTSKIYKEFYFQWGQFTNCFEQGLPSPRGE